MTASFPRYVPDHLVEPVMVQQKSSARLSTKGLPLPFDNSEKMFCMSCLFSAAPICIPPPKIQGAPAFSRAVFSRRLPARTRAHPGFSLFLGEFIELVNDSSENVP